MKGLRSGLPIVGYAKIGTSTGKDSNGRQRPPKKFDHIEITTREVDANGVVCPDLEIMRTLLERGVATCGGCKRSEELGFPEGLPREIPIVLPYDAPDLSFQSRYAMFKGTTLFCSGDGETAGRLEIVGKENGFNVYGDREAHAPCGYDCPDLKAGDCARMSRLHFLIQGMERVGGVYEYRTSSINAAANLANGLEYLHELTDGILRWIPLTLEIGRQQIKTPKGMRPEEIARVLAGDPEALRAEVERQMTLRAPVLERTRERESHLSRDLTDDEVTAYREEFDHDGLNAEPSGAEPVGADVEAHGPNTDANGAKHSVPEASPDDDAPHVHDWVKDDTGALCCKGCGALDEDPGEPKNGFAVEAPRASRDQMLEIWSLCKSAASGDQKKAAALLRELLEKHGLSSSEDVTEALYPEIRKAAEGISG